VLAGSEGLALVRRAGSTRSRVNVLTTRRSPLGRLLPIQLHEFIRHSSARCSAAKT